MDLWLGLYLVSFLNMAFGSPYSVHLNELSFEDAQNYCKPAGILTNLKSKEEITKIQKAIWDTTNKTNKTATSFWIGLKKKKGQCVYKNKPLKGFHWTVDNEEYLHDIGWKEEPVGTCTDERCGQLSVEYRETETKISGLASTACKQKNPFICKRNTDVTCPPPSIFGTHDIIETPSNPLTRHVICSSGAKFTLMCSIDLIWTVIENENMDVSQLCLQCKSGYTRDASGNCVDINECKPFNPCKHTCQNTDGSYKCVCPDDRHCSESTTPTTPHLKNNDVNPTHSNKDESVLIQAHDASTNETAVHIEEHNEDILNIVVPVIIGLLIFVVLLVIIAAIVKGCMRRRLVERARRKAETVALQGSNSTEKVNENKGHLSERDHNII